MYLSLCSFVIPPPACVLASANPRNKQRAIPPCNGRTLTSSPRETPTFTLTHHSRSPLAYHRQFSYRPILLAWRVICLRSSSCSLPRGLPANNLAAKLGLSIYSSGPPCRRSRRNVYFPGGRHQPKGRRMGLGQPSADRYVAPALWRYRRRLPAYQCNCTLNRQAFAPAEFRCFLARFIGPAAKGK